MGRYLKKMHLAAMSCLVLAGCGGGGGGTATAVLNLMVETLTGGTFSADALSVSRYQSITTDWLRAAQDERNTARFQIQNFSWYADSNGNGQQDTNERGYESFSLASSRVDYAHAAGLAGTGQIIAVVDGDFLPTHETISGRVLSYTPPSDTTNFTREEIDHGTAVASVAAGLSGSMIGVAYEAELLLNSYSTLQDLTDATNLARTRGAIVQNNSWGFANSPATNTTFNNALQTPSGSNYLNALRNYTQNGIVVFAAGNNPTDTTAGLMEALPLFVPELEPGWLTVISGVPVFDDTRILSVQRISAPCLQAARWCIAADGSWSGASADSASSYATRPLIGTSFAAPVVSGAIALLAEAFPTLTAHDLRARLIATADNQFAGFNASGRLEVIPGSGVFHDFSTEWGHGFLDLRAALLPIGTPVARMADGTVQVADQPMIVAGGATGDAVARSLAAVPVLVTDALGGDFTMPGSALTAAPSAPPISAQLLQSLFSGDQRPGVIQAYGGADMAISNGGFEMAFIAPDASRTVSGDPAMAATVGQKIAAAGGEVFIGLNITRDDGTLLPGIGGQSNTLAALELGFTHQNSSGAFLELGGSFGMAPGGAGAALSQQSDVRFNAFRVEAGQRDVLRTGDKLRFGVSLPIAVTSGRTEIALPVARSATGINYQQVGIDYAPRDREINLSVTYDAPIGRGTDLFVGAIHAINHGHIAGQRDTAAILGFRKTF